MADTEKVWIIAECEEKMRAHGENTYPHECCGALLGHDATSGNPREVFDVCPLVNGRDDSPRNRFSVSPRDVIAAEREAEARGLEVVGWYHSHPDHPAKPSEYDRQHAWPWYSYVIVSIENGTSGQMRSWRLQEDRTGYVEEKIEVTRPEEVKK